MRTLIPILLVAFCLAATLRIEGVWPPESVRHQIEITIDKLSEPGRMLAALVDEYISPGRGGHFQPPMPQPATVIRAVVDGHGSRETQTRECS